MVGDDDDDDIQLILPPETCQLAELGPGITYWYG